MRGSSGQEPFALGPFHLATSRTAIRSRYTLLPYFYTLAYHAHLTGAPIARALVFNFPEQTALLRAVDAQFMVGPALLVSPVMEQGATKVKATFPVADWYDYESGELLIGAKEHQRVLELHAPLYIIPHHVCGGHLLFRQEPDRILPPMSTTETLGRPYEVVVVLRQDAPEASEGDVLAQGAIYLDNPDSPLPIIGTYTKMHFEVTALAAGDYGFKLVSRAVEHGFPDAENYLLSHIVIYGSHCNRQCLRADMNGMEVTPLAASNPPTLGRIEFALEFSTKLRLSIAEPISLTLHCPADCEATLPSKEDDANFTMLRLVVIVALGILIMTAVYCVVFCRSKDEGAQHSFVSQQGGPPGNDRPFIGPQWPQQPDTGPVGTSGLGVNSGGGGGGAALHKANRKESTFKSLLRGSVMMANSLLGRGPQGGASGGARGGRLESDDVELTNYSTKAYIGQEDVTAMDNSTQRVMNALGGGGEVRTERREKEVEYVKDVDALVQEDQVVVVVEETNGQRRTLGGNENEDDVKEESSKKKKKKKKTATPVMNAEKEEDKEEEMRQQKEKAELII